MRLLLPFATCLTSFYGQSNFQLNGGYVANTVPVFKGKKGYKYHSENFYLLLSLLSIISKIMERCVFNKVRERVARQSARAY